MIQNSNLFKHLHFFFNDKATTEIYTLSLHDALPISDAACRGGHVRIFAAARAGRTAASRDRKSTRLNSSHGSNSYAVFCFKKKNDDDDNVTHPDHNRDAPDRPDQLLEN